MTPTLAVPQSHARCVASHARKSCWLNGRSSRTLPTLQVPPGRRSRHQPGAYLARRYQVRERCACARCCRGACPGPSEPDETAWLWPTASQLCASLRRRTIAIKLMSIERVGHGISRDETLLARTPSLSQLCFPLPRSTVHLLTEDGAEPGALSFAPLPSPGLVPGPAANHRWRHCGQGPRGAARVHPRRRGGRRHPQRPGARFCAGLPRSRGLRAHPPTHPHAQRPHASPACACRRSALSC